MALSLNGVTPTGHITIIIYWCVGIFNIRGLTFERRLSFARAGSEFGFKFDGLPHLLKKEMAFGRADTYSVMPLIGEQV